MGNSNQLTLEFIGGRWYLWHINTQVAMKYQYVEESLNNGTLTDEKTILWSSSSHRILC